MRRGKSVFEDTADELLLLAVIFLTLGLIYYVGPKRPTEKSLIHPLFEFVDFFDTQDW